MFCVNCILGFALGSMYSPQILTFMPQTTVILRFPSIGQTEQHSFRFKHYENNNNNNEILFHSI